MRTLLIIILCLTMFIASGCQEESPQGIKIPPQSAQNGNGGPKTTTPADKLEAALAAVETNEEQSTQEGPLTQPEPSSKTEQSVQDEQLTQEPPRPPILEDFQGKPQLSLFPRVGDFRPEESSDRLPYWNTFIEHLVKVTGIAEDQTTGSRGWVFRSIKSIDSVGYFSPLGVEPDTSYQVSFTLAAELEEGASAGLGIHEFNEFLWIPSQYSEELFKQHYRGTHEGISVTGTTKEEHSFTFTTGAETHMIHVTLFREGAHDRNSVMFDDIKIEKASP